MNLFGLKKLNRDWVLVWATVLLGLVFMWFAGTLAIIVPSEWSVKASMDSILDPDAQYVAMKSRLVIEPILPAILTPLPWQNTYVTPSSDSSGPISFAYDGVVDAILQGSVSHNLHGKVEIGTSEFPSDLPYEPFTPREKDVLLQVVSGRSNKQIAKKLKISPKTVEVYLYRITRKLRVPTRVGVAVMAVKLGLVDVDYADLQIGEFEEL